MSILRYLFILSACSLITSDLHAQFLDYGTDLIFDWNVLRMTFPLTTEVRLIQPIDYGKFQAEMLFSITF